MAIYMQAGDVQGDVTSKGFEKQIELKSLHFGVSRQVNMSVGNTSNMASSQLSFDKLHITKAICSASPLLFTKLLNGTLLPEVTISCCRTGKELSPYLVYTLNDVMISHYDLPSHSEDEEIESYSLSYSKIELRFTQRGKRNQDTTHTSACYDLESARMV